MLEHCGAGRVLRPAVKHAKNELRGFGQEFHNLGRQLDFGFRVLLQFGGGGALKLVVAGIINPVA